MTLAIGYIKHFEPFLFVMVMGTGISSDLLHAFPYPAKWLRICSYIMFAIACLLFIGLQFFAIVHMIKYTRRHTFQVYFQHYFRNLMHNVFWGTYPMGLVTIINYLSNLVAHEAAGTDHARRLLYLIYALWWYDVLVSILSAWGISFLIWQDYYSISGLSDKEDLSKTAAEQHLKSILLLAVIPLVVVASCSGLFTMTDLFAQTFNRNIQLLTLVVTALLWLHSIIFVFILISIFFWNLYVNKIPAMSQVFTMFLVLGPLGQGSFGILLLTDNIRKYVVDYYPRKGTPEDDILRLAVPWSFKVLGLTLALGLLAMGYFFSFISFLSIVSYRNTKIIQPSGKPQRVYHFHKGFWAMTFPMGTMSLGSTEVFVQYNEYVPMGAFRVIGAIYAVICILWTIFCLLGTMYKYTLANPKPIQQEYDTTTENTKTATTEISDCIAGPSSSDYSNDDDTSEAESLTAMGNVISHGI